MGERASAPYGRSGESMFGFQSLGKILIFFGLIILGIGLLFLVLPKIPFLGKLPGDIFIRRGNFTFYFPLITCLLLSILLTILINLFRK